MPELVDVEWMSVAEVSESVGLSVRTVRKWIHRGWFTKDEVVWIGGTVGYRIARPAVNRVISSMRVTTSARKELGHE